MGEPTPMKREQDREAEIRARHQSWNRASQEAADVDWLLSELARLRTESHRECINAVCFVCERGVEPWQTHVDVWVHRIGDVTFQCPANGIRRLGLAGAVGPAGHGGSE